MESFLPPKEELKLADVQEVLFITIICPYCRQSWEIKDDNLNDCTRSDPINVIEQCPKCNQWMKTFEDDVAIDLFYEDFRETDD